MGCAARGSGETVYNAVERSAQPNTNIMFARPTDQKNVKCGPLMLQNGSESMRNVQLTPRDEARLGLCGVRLGEAT